MTTYLSDGSTIDDWKIGTPAEIAYVEPLPDPAEVLAERVALAIADLKDTLNALPPPQVHVAAPELGAIVQAVTSLNGPASAEDIAEAIARTLHIPEPASNEPLVDAILKAFEKMDHRMKGMVPAFGASGPSNISSDPNRRLGIVESISGTVTAVSPEYEHRFDYDTRTDSNPVYVGFADPNTATSVATWTVYKFTFDASNRATRKQKQTTSWDNRTAGW